MRLRTRGGRRTEAARVVSSIAEAVLACGTFDGGTMTIAGWTPETHAAARTTTYPERVGAGAIASAAVMALYDPRQPAGARGGVIAEREGVDADRVRRDVRAGPMPRECSCGARGRRVFVRGNGGSRAQPLARRGAWRAARAPSSRDSPHGDVDDGLGPTLFRHGDPRRDDEIVTTRDPRRRVRGRASRADERVVVAGHVHVQVDQAVAGRRYVNAGSVGMPYEGRRGAFWALLGPDVELRRTTVRRRRRGATDPRDGLSDAEEQVGWPPQLMTWTRSRLLESQREAAR